MKPELHRRFPRSFAPLFAAIYLLLSGVAALGATRFVDASSQNPTPPYTNWSGAAQVIQDAIDVAEAGDEIFVTNGTYSAGGRLTVGPTTNRVALYKPITLRSVNGPLLTIIEGHQVPDATNGPSAIRCVYVTNGASLVGFTLTNGATALSDSGGGLRCDYSDASISNCIIIGNSAHWTGGGAFGGILTDCVLLRNSAVSGGGTSGSHLNSCLVISNTATSAGGVYGGKANSSLITGNSALSQGGATSAELNHCRLLANRADLYVGGASACQMTNCLVAGNTASEAGGAAAGTLVNCTVAANIATVNAGGVAESALYNSIVYSNEAPVDANYDHDCVLNYCCTAPEPFRGQGNITLDPRLAGVESGLRLLSNSPCINAGHDAFMSATQDLDGKYRFVGEAIDIGAYELQEPPAPTAPYFIVQPSSQTTVPGANVAFQAKAFGTLPIERQWFLNGAPLSGETNGVLVLRNIQAHDLGAYSLRVSNAVGAVETSAAWLSFATPAIHYVDANSSNPSAPFTNWITAARTIQDAVEVAFPGEEVVVTNGLYANGGRPIQSRLTNRVALYKPVLVRSINGPELTIIQGNPPGETNEEAIVRCAYLTNGATLQGFTLTGGRVTRFAGADHIRDLHGGGVWCESTNALISNCLILSNTSAAGGGGAFRGSFANCTFQHNQASTGAGARESALQRCLVGSNTADGSGGGLVYGTAQGSALIGNIAGDSGGAVFGSAVVNCTLTGNRSKYRGGGASWSRLTNCIVYFNNAPSEPNYETAYGSQLSYCCTTPLPESGPGNLDVDPVLASSFRLSLSSPCRAAGDPAVLAGTDIDGEVWAGLPSIGCDELYSGSQTGALSVAIIANPVRVAPRHPVQFSAVITGRCSESTWDFADGTTSTNQPFPTHSWAGPGTYQVILRARNDTYPEGVVVSNLVQVTAGVRYVSLNSPNPQPPYTNAATGARVIQDAVDAAAPGDEILVDAGVYDTGGRAVHGTLTNRVVVDKPVVLRSIYGPATTIIEGRHPPFASVGFGAVRCVYLAQGATLSGFTLRRGSTQMSLSTDDHNLASGGGVFCDEGGGVVTNCTITSNSADLEGGGVFGAALVDCLIQGNNSDQPGGSEFGGGASRSHLVRCTVSGNLANIGAGVAFSGSENSVFTQNWAFSHGGADFAGTLRNCTLINNRASQAGGASESMLFNCIAYYNTATNSPNYGSSGVYYSCTTPDPPTDGVGGGAGNITAAPALTAFKLMANSPCINAGNNDYRAASVDYFGEPRIVQGTVDMGAHEFQTAASSLPYPWLLRYGVPIVPGVDQIDSDADGASTLHEWWADTNPTNPASVFKLVPLSLGLSNRVAFTSSTNRHYTVQFSTPQEGHLNWGVLPGWNNTLGANGFLEFTDTNAAPGRLYRVQATR